jgi:predicted  nucleic acid-binding Zn-ribbon protein
MVSTDTTQLNRECNSWRENLRSYRNEMGQLRNQLQEVARGQQDKELLTEVEHYHNQFYIQQINIHDLKQAIKNHDRKISLEQSSLNGKLSEQTLSDHEELHSQYENLEHTLSELKIEFTHFLTKA